MGCGGLVLSTEMVLATERSASGTVGSVALPAVAAAAPRLCGMRTSGVSFLYWIGLIVVLAGLAARFLAGWPGEAPVAIAVAGFFIMLAGRLRARIVARGHQPSDRKKGTD